MKKGFSFGEMLATLIIMSVVIGISIPVISRSVATNYKPLYKSGFQKVEQVVAELINDVAAYPSGEFVDNTFCSNFFSNVNTIGTVECANTFNSQIPATPNAITTNGMKWYNMDEDFVFGNCPPGAVAGDECIKVSVDINGNKGKNTDSDSDSDRDILDIYIYRTGKVTVESGGPEETYLTN